MRHWLAVLTLVPACFIKPDPTGPHADGAIADGTPAHRDRRVRAGANGSADCTLWVNGLRGVVGHFAGQDTWFTHGFVGITASGTSAALRYVALYTR